MKITMNVEDVALTMAQPSLLKQRLGCILDGKHTRRPVTRWTVTALLVSTGVILPLLASAQTSQAAGQSDSARASQKAQAARVKLSNSRLKQLILGIIGYAVDHDETFPPMQNMFQLKKAIFRYVKSEQVFRQPGSGTFYVPNAALSKKQMANMDAPSKTAALYEAQMGSDGKRGVAFEDGHIKRMTASEWTQLKKHSEIG